MTKDNFTNITLRGYTGTCLNTYNPVACSRFVQNFHRN